MNNEEFFEVEEGWRIILNGRNRDLINGINENNYGLIRKIMLNTCYNSFEEACNIIKKSEYKMFYNSKDAFTNCEEELAEMLLDKGLASCFDYDKWLTIKNDEYFTIKDSPMVLYIPKKYYIELDSHRMEVSKDEFETYESLDRNEKLALCCYLNCISENFEDAFNLVDRGDYSIYDNPREAFEDFYSSIYCDLEDDNLTYYFDFDGWCDDNDDLYDYDGYIIKLIY